jgi:hypothetical protein
MASNISILKEELALAVASAAAKRIICNAVCNAAEDAEKQARSRLLQAEADERERNVHRVRVSDRHSQFQKGKGAPEVFVSDNSYVVDLAVSPDPEAVPTKKSHYNGQPIMIEVNGTYVHASTYSRQRDKSCSSIAPNTILYMADVVDRCVWEGQVTSEGKTEKLSSEAWLWKMRERLYGGGGPIGRRRIADPKFYQFQRSWTVKWKKISVLNDEWKKYLTPSVMKTFIPLSTRPPPCV